jgi:hypothetical protein
MQGQMTFDQIRFISLEAERNVSDRSLPAAGVVGVSVSLDMHLRIGTQRGTRADCRKKGRGVVRKRFLIMQPP